MREKEVATKTAILAGEFIKKHCNKPLRIKTKHNQHFNLVTHIDLKSEELIVSEIKKVFPEHSFFGEEKGKDITDSDYLWVIDPIDGTNNFIQQFPFFCISIALYRKNKPFLGVVYDPSRKELFFAQRSKGAFLNGKKIKVSIKDKIRGSFFSFGIYDSRGGKLRKILRQYQNFLETGALDVRRTGSAALDLCYTACGRFDGYWETKLSPWDFAAGSLILQEAGGRATTIQGEPLSLNQSSILASNGKIHKEMLGMLQK